MEGYQKELPASRLIFLFLVCFSCNNVDRVKNLYSDGSIKEIINLDNGLKNGEYLHFYPNGTIRIKCFYVNDTIQGDRYEYFDNGILMTKSFYSDGKETGPLEVFHSNGQPRLIAFLREGHYDSTYFQFSELGDTVAYAYFKRDSVLYEKRFHKAGIESYFAEPRMEMNVTTDSVIYCLSVMSPVSSIYTAIIIGQFKDEEKMTISDTSFIRYSRSNRCCLAIKNENGLSVDYSGLFIETDSTRRIVYYSYPITIKH